MESIYNFLTKNLDNHVKKNNVYYFDGEQIKAVAFKQGCKCDCVSKIKEAIKGWGFKYDYDFDAYIFKDRKDEKYRSEKNAFISSLINWKITKTSNNGEDSGKLYFQGLQ